MSLDAPRAWIIVSGAAGSLNHRERVAASDLGRLLAREGYGLVAGTWDGTDRLVTEAFVRGVDPQDVSARLVHIENNPPHSSHDIRLGRVIQSSPAEPYSEEAVDLADVGIVVSGRNGSKPTMDALTERGKPVLPLAWLGNDSLDCLTDLLRDAGGDQARRRFLLPLIDPASGCDESLSRALGAYTTRSEDVFISYHRADTGADAGRLGAALAEAYGTRRIFVDYMSFHAARELDEIVTTRAARAKLLIVFVGSNWLEKVASENDYVRREILAAREGGGRVVAIFMDGKIPDAAHIPEPLRFIRDINALSFDRNQWDETMRRCKGVVDDALGVTRMQPTRGLPV